MSRPRARLAGVWVVVALGLLAGCTDAERGGAEPSTSPSPTFSSSEPLAPPTTSAPPTGSATAPPRRPVTIAVAGDVHFEGVLRDRLDDPATALAPATGALAAADVAIVNLETSVGSGGRPEPGKRFTFQAPPSAFAAVAAAGIDVVTMANNHALDFGRPSLRTTFAAADAAAVGDPPLAVVGIGRTAAVAFRPARITVDGVSVAVLGATTAGLDPTADPTGHWAATATRAGTADAIDPRRLLRAVREADVHADVVVVYLHWGVQGRRCPDAGQESLAARLVRSGADIVVGSHAHVVQGDGRLGRGYVAYGLGNYAWYTQSAGPAATTGVLTLTVRPPRSTPGRATVTKAVWSPAVIGGDGLPAPASDRVSRRFEVDRRALRECAGLADSHAAG